METQTETQLQANASELVRHVRRPSWGVGVEVWERNGKRAYQFSDGKMRVIKEGFFHLLEPTQSPGDGRGRSARRLAERVAAGETGTSERLPTFLDQLALIESRYPRVFDEPAWAKKHRGDAKKGRALKRHRDPLLEFARTRWDEGQMRALLQTGNHAAVLERVCEVLASTDLVERRRVSELSALRATEVLAASLVGVLFEDDDAYAPHFNRLVAELARQKGPATNWPLLTAMRALLYPHEHVCVRPSVWELQGRIVAPGFSAPSSFDAASYERYRRIGSQVRRELNERDWVPRDMLDVYDFVWETLRRGSRDDLLSAAGDETRKVVH